VTVWWSTKGVIHCNFMKPSTIITVNVYCKELDSMMRKLSTMHPKIVNRCNPLFLHDNAKLSTARITILKLEELKFVVMPHPAYSPNLASTDFHFFWNLNHFLVEKTQFSRGCRKCVPRFCRLLYSKLLFERHGTTSVEMAEVH